jgi:hypothetical protein
MTFQESTIEQRVRGGLAACRVAAGAIFAMLASCGANGDFGRVRPSLVPDYIHDWLGRDAALNSGKLPSEYNLTEDERLLRDLAYPLIEPPYDRQRWFSVLSEFGITQTFKDDWWFFDRDVYVDRLMGGRFFHGPYYRSTAGRYSQLIDDIRNDVVRIDPFFEAARRVVDLDHKRQQSLTYVTRLTPFERANALNRVKENVLVVGWTQCSLDARAAVFRYALERLVIAEPARVAVEAERALTLLQIRITQNRLVRPPPFCPVAGPAVLPAGIKVTK